jgi:hypothetical protein
MFAKSEIKYLVIVILVMTLALAFNDGQDTFAFGFWLQNFVAVLLIVTFSFLLHQLAHKIVARMNGFDTEFTWWGLQSKYISKKSFKSPFRTARAKNKEKSFPRKIRIFGKEVVIDSFPIGIIISLIVMLFSNGLVWFLAIGQYNLLLKKSSRLGRRYIHVTDYEEAKIALAGPMTHVVILMVFSFFNKNGVFDQLIFINALLALFYMLPIHKLDGTKVLFGSRLLWVTSAVFMIFMVVLVYNISSIPMIIISMVATLIVAALYYYFTFYR